MRICMYLRKFNKKLHQEDIKDYSLYNFKNAQLELLKKCIKDYESYNSAKDFALRKQQNALYQYEEWDKKGRNINYSENYISNVFTNETPKFENFETKEDLLNHFATDAKKDYIKMKNEMKYFDSKEWYNINKKFHGMKENEEYYWKEQLYLNGYPQENRLEYDIQMLFIKSIFC